MTLLQATETREPARESDCRVEPADQAYLPHAESAGEVAERLRTDLQRGLSESEAAVRQFDYGANELVRKGGTPWWKLVLSQLREVVVLLLLAAAVIAVALGEWIDTLAILVIVVLNAALGLYQHWKTEHALEALRSYSAPTARVRRDGRSQRIESRALVPGDVIELEAGDQVPADARLISGYGLQTLEAALTGESVPVAKQPQATLAAATPLADRTNMLFQGTVVSGGQGQALVTATGESTELGRLATLLDQQDEVLTPLQKQVHRLGQVLVVLCVVLVAAIAALQVARGQSWLETIRLAISLAVAAVPEGLPAVLTITLALGAQRLARRQALVRRLSSVETLGSVSVICSDKTGTLTRNQMTVEAIWLPAARYQVSGSGYSVAGTIDRLPDIAPTFVAKGADLSRTDRRSTSDLVEAIDLHQLLTIGMWCNRSVISRRTAGDDQWHITGDPTEAALLVLAAKAGLERDAVAYDIEHEQPFDSDRKRMSVVVQDLMGMRTAMVKGAPESVLTCCTAYQYNGQIRPLDAAARQTIRAALDQLAGQALRVLAVAYRRGLQPQELNDAESHLVFAGLVGLTDPPREEARVAIQKCHRAGIRPVMITGDHPETAQAIAQELQLLRPGADVLTGARLETMKPDEFDAAVGRAAVFARVTAEQKHRIVQSLQRRGEIVAMTGDGVNDGPAVKSADIGIAMGITGTDVTKEASAMILTDDNFASIVHAVEEGRAIYENIRRFVDYLLAGNAGKLLFMSVAALAGWHTPLLAIQILWLNLVTDGLPALALGAEPTHDDLMRRPPRSPAEPLVGWRRAARIVGHGALGASAALIGFWSVYQGSAENLAAAQTVAFCILGISQLLYAFVCRSSTMTLWRLGWATNRPLLGAVGVSLVLQLIIVLVPALHAAFGIESYPTTAQWLLIGGLSVAPAALLELLKMVRRPEESVEPVR